MPKEHSFLKGDLVVYPAHGVGKILSIETQAVAGHELKVFVIAFEKERMTLRLPMAKATAAGLRALSSQNDIKKAFDTLKKASKTKKGLWSRRAQEYELKINSGKLTLIAEVIRDLYRNADQSDQSYSERQIFQVALERLISEIAAAEAVAPEEVEERIEKSLKASSMASVAAA